jgi:hypothetical protein
VLNIKNKKKLDDVLKEELKKNKEAARNIKKHWKEIQNIEDIDFGGVFTSYSLQHIHRGFKGTDEGLLAIFAVFEFLHNLAGLINDINSERRMTAINEAAGMEICKLGQNNLAMGFSKELNSRPVMIEFYKKRIFDLKNGEISVMPVVWNYVYKGKKMSKEKIKDIEKRVADIALNMLRMPYNILGFIEKAIEGEIIKKQ